MKWFEEKYKQHLGDRYVTMAGALAAMPENPLIVETGCERSENGVPDWGGGCSTSVFLDFLEHHGSGRLISIDNNLEHLGRAQFMVKNNPRVSFIHADSKVGLAQIGAPISLLYLDSWDYPIFEVTDLYGGRENYENAIKIVEAMSNEEFHKLFGHIVSGCQQHTLNELTAASPFIQPNTLVLIDDCRLAGGGKGRVAQQWMRANGWECLIDSYQTLWRPPQ